MTTKTHFIVYGVGAVGGMYGAQLLAERNWQNLESAYDVSFIARNKTYEVLDKEGIKFHVRNDDGSIDNFDSKEVDVYDSLTGLQITNNVYPVILLCVKSKDTEACAQEIVKFANTNKLEAYTVISIQNGVENEEILAEYLGKDKVIGAYTNVLAEVIAPGEYVRKGKYWLTLGEMDQSLNIEINSQKRLDFLIEILTKANLVVKQSKDIRADLWEKLVWNAAFNPLSVLYETDIKGLLANLESCQKVKDVMRETRELAQVLGIQVNPEIDTKHFDRTSALDWQGFKTSMLQDYLRGRELELEQLLGVVVRLAKENNFNAPNAAKLYLDLKQKLCLT